MGEPRFFLQVLSNPDLRSVDGESLLPAGKPLALLIYLAVTGSPTSRDDLVALLWPGADRLHGRASVRQALWSLRRILDDDRFVADDPVSISGDLIHLDLAELREAVANGDLEHAAELWKGPPLLGFEFPKTPMWSEWSEQLRVREEKCFGDALALRAKAKDDAGELKEAVGLLRMAIEVQPDHFSHRRALIEALLSQRSLSEAGHAIAEAERIFDDPESRSALESLEDRLRILASEGAGSGGPQGIRTEFVGRTAEFSAMAAEWRVARRGASRVGLIKGLPGIGKTRLAEEIALLGSSDGGCVVSVKAVELERTLDWGTITEIARALHALPGAAGISNRSAATLTRLVPSLINVPGSLPGPPPAFEAAAVTDALLDLVAAVSEERPLLLLVDDLQWVDKQSRAALSHLGRSLLVAPVFLLFTSRTGDRDPEVDKALESIRRMQNAVAVELGPLYPGEVAELLALFLDGLEPEQLESLASRIFGITRGNPLFVVEILKLFHSKGLLTWKGEDKWQIDPVCISGELPVPETVESAIRRRLEGLSSNARLLAAHLAEKARPIQAEDLRRFSGLDPFEVSDGISQLFRHDLVHRTPDGRVEFVHDAVRVVARESLVPSLHGARNGSRRRRAWHITQWAVSTLALVALAAVLFLGEGPGEFVRSVLQREAPTYPYGRGRLLVRTTDGFFWVTPPARGGGPWVTTDTVISFPQPVLKGPFRRPDGSLFWFAKGGGPEDPPYVGLPRLDGSVDPLWKTDGDVEFEDLSPDGKTALISEEILGAPQYSRRLRMLDLESGASSILFESQTQTGNARWSPDGLRIVVPPSVYGNSLVFMNPGGRVLDTLRVSEARTVGMISWCSDSERIVFTAVNDRSTSLGLLNTITREYDLFALPVSGPDLVSCLGTGSAVAFRGAVGTEPELLIHDFAGDSTYAIPELTGNRMAYLQWVPEQARPWITALEVSGEDISVGAGERVQLAAIGRFSNGQTEPIKVAWEASDPALVSVDSTGTITGNRAGHAFVVARFAEWLDDTVSVTVTQGDRSNVLFRDDFSSGLSSWVSFGTPEPRLLRLGSESVLSLEGDGRYDDGLLGVPELDLRMGATVEVDFEFPLTRTDKQRVGFCVEHAEGDTLTSETMDFGRIPDQALCIRYPAYQFELFDSLEARIRYTHTGRTELVALPEDFLRSRWTHLAFQVRPDGTVSVFANRRFIRQVDFRVPVDTDTPWRVRLYGASFGTHLYVREVTVWRGPHYAESPSG